MGDHLLQKQQQQQVMAAPDLDPGFRFHPTDEELIICYLAPKVLNRGFCANAIGEVDLNKCEPWELPGKAKMGEKEWYFFCHMDRKYATGTKMNRATKDGHWKATGKDKEIYTPSSATAPMLIGKKKTLVFYKGKSPKDEKTKWVMHEYRLEGSMAYPSKSITINRSSLKDEWVVCRIFHKSSGIKKDMASSYAMDDAMVIDHSINNPMSMPITMPTMGDQGFTPNFNSCTLPPHMDASSLYGTMAGATSLQAAQPVSSYGQLLHAGLSMGSLALPMNVSNYFGNNHLGAAVQTPTIFYNQQQPMQIAEEGLMAADSASRLSPIVSWEDMAGLNNNEQNNHASSAEATTEILSVLDMDMDDMWKY